MSYAVVSSEKCLHFSLSINAEEYLRLYEGSAKTVYAQSLEGASVRFPANILQPYVTHKGIHGRFVIYFDSENRFKRVEKQ